MVQPLLLASWLDWSIETGTESQTGLYDLRNRTSSVLGSSRAVVAVCLDSSQEGALNQGDKFSAASLKLFVLPSCSSEKVTLST